MKMVSILSVAILFGALSAVAGAEEAPTAGRFAWVDLPRVMKEYGRASEMVAEFEGEKAAKEAEVQKLVAEIERMEGEMLLLSEKARTVRTEEIMRKKIAVNAMIEEAERQLSVQSMARQGKLLEEVSRATETLALRDNYSLVFRGEILLYKSPALDITNAVIAELNRTPDSGN